MHHFPEEYVTDRSQRFMASEIVREKLMRFTGEELPYSVTVEIERFDYNPDTDGFHINALILGERIGQKKMVIGKTVRRSKPSAAKRVSIWKSCLAAKSTQRLG